jgi:hypothetical protein
VTTGPYGSELTKPEPVVHESAARRGSGQSARTASGTPSTADEPSRAKRNVFLPYTREVFAATQYWTEAQ